MTNLKNCATIATSCKKIGETMFNKIFDPQNKFWQTVGKAPFVFALSILWLVMCLPVITIVPATIALYDAVARNLRPDEKGLFRRYFRTFVKELKRGIPLSILWVIIVWLLLCGLQALQIQAEADAAYGTWLTVYQISLLIPTGVFLWMNVLESRFVYGFFALLKNSFTFFMGYLPYSLAMVLIFIVAILACYIAFPYPLFFVMPVLLMLALSFPVEKVFRTLMEEKETENTPAESTEAIEE